MKKIYKASLLLMLVLTQVGNIAYAQYPFWRWTAGPKTTNGTGIYPTAVGVGDNNAYPGARIGGTAQFKDNKLYIFGGHNSTSNRFADLWSYDINSQVWTLLNAASNTYASTTVPYGVSKTPNTNIRPGGRSGINSVIIGDDIYTFGGQGYGTDGTSLGSGKLNDFWKYNITSNTWTLLRGVLTNAGATVIGSKGGIDDGSFAPRSRSNACLAAVGTDIYLFGGEGVGVTGDLWKWDTLTSKWLWLTGENGATTAVNVGLNDPTNTPSARQGSAFVAIGTKIYLFGGTTNANTETNMQNDLWVYDTATGFWNLITPSNAAPPIRKDVQGWAAGGNLYIFGGVSRADGTTSKVVNDLWKYDPVVNSWTKLKGEVAPAGTYAVEDYTAATVAPAASNTSIPAGRVGILAASNGNKLYLFGGDRTTAWTQRYSDLWTTDLDETVLPVNFISFAAKATTTGVQLNWKIASETNHKQYIVSRSTNGKDYTIVTTTTAYSTTDNNVASGTYYYKLEQQDNDGTINQLAVQVVKVGLSTNYHTVYPNPTKGIATLTLAAGAYTNYTVVGVQGNTVATGKINNTDTILKVNLSSVAAGTYIIKLLGVNANTAARVIKL